MGPCLSRFCTPPAPPPSNVFASTAPATAPSQPPKPLRARRGRSRRPWWRRARSAAIQDEDVWSARVTKAAAEDVEEVVEPPSPVPGSGSRLLRPEGGGATRIWV